jgi:uncharacterized protein (DUF433 family)
MAGTTLKVVELVRAQKACGWSPEEIHFQHPYLSMSQIYSVLASVLAYDWDPKTELAADMEQQLEPVRRLKAIAEAFP